MLMKRFRKANPVSLPELLHSIVDELESGKEFYFERLQSDWKHLVGETLARNLRPLSIENNILTAVVSSPGWLTEFQFQKKKLLEKINSYGKKNKINIYDIRFVLDKSL